MEFNNDFSSDISGLKKNKWKKEIIIGTISSFLVISLIIIIIIISIYSSNKNEENLEELGSIKCVYDILHSSSEIYILGENYDNSKSKFDIFINGEKI